ncbi:hypothetical protein H8E07_15535 [bacterium]|nr:hypothetical protein [bacterium]
MYHERGRDLIESLDQEAWDRLVGRVPAEIAGHEPHEFGHWSGVTAGELGELARG